MRRRHRPRTVLVTGLALFAVLNLGLSLAIATVWPDLRDPLYYGKQCRLLDRLQTEPKPITVVFLGTSRTDRGFFSQPLEARIEKETGRKAVVFNFGIDGAGALTRLIFLRRLLDEGIRPDLLLLEVLPPTLNNSEPYVEHPQLKGRRLNWNEIGLVARYGGSADALFQSWTYSWLLPWYEHRFLILSRLSPALVPSNRFQVTLKNVNAWGWQDIDRSKLSPQARSEALSWTREFWTRRWLHSPFTIEGSQIEAYRELLATCQAEAIPTSLIWMPEGPTFRGWYPPGSVEQIHEIMKVFQREYGVSIIDAQTWIDEEAVFVDSHHLLAPGARLFSRRLGREVIRPWAANRKEEKP